MRAKLSIAILQFCRTADSRRSPRYRYSLSHRGRNRYWGTLETAFVRSPKRLRSSSLANCRWSEGFPASPKGRRRVPIAFITRADEYHRATILDGVALQPLQNTK